MTEYVYRVVFLEGVSRQGAVSYMVERFINVMEVNLDSEPMANVNMKHNLLPKFSWKNFPLAKSRCFVMDGLELDDCPLRQRRPFD